MSSDLDELLQQSWLYREWVGKAESRGLEQGLEQGKEQGRREGLRAGLFEALVGVIGPRFGALSVDLVRALNKADIPTLEQLTPIAATGTLEEVRSALGL